MWGFKWEKEIKWIHICKGTKSCCLNSCLCRKSREVWGTESSDQVLGRKRLILKLNQCSVSVQRLSTVKKGLLIKKNMTHWRNIKKDKTFLISIFNSCLNSYSCLNISFKMFKFICFESFLLMIKNSKSVLLLQKNNRLFPQNNLLFPQNNRLFCDWQLCEGMNLISFLNFCLLQITLKKEFLVNEPVLKADHVQKEVTTSHKGIYSKILKI